MSPWSWTHGSADWAVATSGAWEGQLPVCIALDAQGNTQQKIIDYEWSCMHAVLMKPAAAVESYRAILCLLLAPDGVLPENKQKQSWSVLGLKLAVIYLLLSACKCQDPRTSRE